LLGTEKYKSTDEFTLFSCSDMKYFSPTLSN
jgi:hypothetical protein